MNLRPDGLEIVYAEEDTDIQWPLLQTQTGTDPMSGRVLMCNPGRNAVAASILDPVPRAIPEIRYR